MTHLSSVATATPPSRRSLGGRLRARHGAVLALMLAVFLAPAAWAQDEDAETLGEGESCSARFGGDYVCCEYREQKNKTYFKKKGCTTADQCYRHREFPRDARIVLDGAGQCAEAPKVDLDNP